MVHQKTPHTLITQNIQDQHPLQRPYPVPGPRIPQPKSHGSYSVCLNLCNNVIVHWVLKNSSSKVAWQFITCSSKAPAFYSFSFISFLTVTSSFFTSESSASFSFKASLRSYINAIVSFSFSTISLYSCCCYA